MSRYETAYCGPSVMTSEAKTRETPYLTSSQVTGEPSSQVAPSRIVNFHDFASADGVPVSVARSGTSVLACLLVLAELVRRQAPEQVGAGPGEVLTGVDARRVHVVELVLHA